MASELPHESQVKPTHFFKIISDQSLHEGKLMIPRKFVEKYGEGLPKTLFLKPPNGAAWKLNLVKSGGKIWFQKGWKQFAEHHSLADGHLLVFRYKGTSHFQVYIFNKSALEIKYPFKRVEAKRASNSKGNQPANDENLEDHRAGQKRQANLSFEFRKPCEVGSSIGVKIGNTLKSHNVAVHLIDRKCKGKQVVTTNEVTTLDRASSFKTCNPSFLLVMYPSYVIGRGPLNFPKMFVKSHLDLDLDLDKKCGEIHLGVFNGKVWHVRYRIRIANTRPKFELLRGWKTFVKDNNLKVGDVCTFELIHRTELTFHVHIFRKTDNPSCSTSQKSSKVRTATQGQRKRMKVITSGKQSITAENFTTLDRANSFETCNPSFHTVMRPSYVEASCHLNLPSEFGKRHLDLGKKEGDIHLQLLNGRIWPGRYVIRKDDRRTKFVVSGGWKEFVKDNDLKVGDVCTFELIPGTQFTFKVHIYRDSFGKQTIQLVQHLKNLPKGEQLFEDKERE